MKTIRREIFFQYSSKRYKEVPDCVLRNFNFGNINKKPTGMFLTLYKLGFDKKHKKRLGKV